MSACKNCLKVLVCKYNDGHNLYCKDDYECPHFLDKTIIEKQIPKKPKTKELTIGYLNGEEIKGSYHHCPCCKGFLGINMGMYKFCPCCGQALDWSDTK